MSGVLQPTRKEYRRCRYGAACQRPRWWNVINWIFGPSYMRTLVPAAGISGRDMLLHPKVLIYGTRAWSPLCLLMTMMNHIWRRHQMETFSALLVLWEGNSLVTSEIPSQRLATRNFDVFFDRRLTNDWVSNRDTGDLRRHRAHYDVTVMCSLLPPLSIAAIAYAYFPFCSISPELVRTVQHEKSVFFSV